MRSTVLYAPIVLFIHTQNAREEESARQQEILNLTQMMPFLASFHIIQLQRENREEGLCICGLQTEPLTVSKVLPPQTSTVAQNTTVVVIRLHSGSTSWKTINTFSPLGSASTLNLYCSVLALELSKNNTRSYFLRPRVLEKSGGFSFDATKCMFSLLLFFFFTLSLFSSVALKFLQYIKEVVVNVTWLGAG